MTIKELNKTRVPIVSINPKLEKYKNIVLFQDKLDDANTFLEKVGLPADEIKKNGRSLKLRKKTIGRTLRRKKARRLVGK
jgi:hypothetical protein